ncbi:AAA family ATPase [Lentimicrobium sp. S6]|uniref:AAA family ATPase n=1 Tax=Lentimicrobium sp. S6 TaxID=2735872 RepID=UPI001555D285|nr:AAA family ATPase [Lentimicrobium sp. S6]NPD47600.1 ATP-binding protein [Lentimicrobium sp. S6]
MILEKFSYSEYQSLPRHWEVKEFKLGKVNLFVGSNASGKTRTLNVISGLAKVLTDAKIKYNSGYYKACFLTLDGVKIEYDLEYTNGIINKEILLQNGIELYYRKRSGEGEILNYSLGAEGKKVKFKIPTNELVAHRRDEFQYPYLEKLYQWASNTRHFRFATDDEKHTLALLGTNKASSDKSEDKEGTLTIRNFKKGVAKHRDEYLQRVVNDFNEIGYNVSKIDTGILQSIRVDSHIGAKVVGLRVFEKDRDGFTDQYEMSDGMFRALSIIIHYNYYALENRKSNILIDDIGEGLDFERSSKLISLLIKKTNDIDVQLNMTTNDKFVMNNTNLEFWQIITRKRGVVEVHNKFNSKEKFEDFKYTGLNNFDFFSTDFFKEGFE